MPPAHHSGARHRPAPESPVQHQEQEPIFMAAPVQSLGKIDEAADAAQTSAAGRKNLKMCTLTSRTKMARLRTALQIDTPTIEHKYKIKYTTYFV